MVSISYSNVYNSKFFLMIITDELLLLIAQEKARRTGWRQAGQFKHARRSLPPKQQGLGVTEELSAGRSPAGGQPIIERSEELNFAKGDQRIPPDRRLRGDCWYETRINRMLLELRD